MRTTAYSISIFLSILLASGALFAQNGELSGRVTDKKTGEPLVGATVLLEGTTLGDATDQNGRYLIRNIPPKTYNVTASFLGFESLTQYNIVIRSEGNIDINFDLAEDTQVLGEVVVTPNPFEKLDYTPMSVQKLSQEEVAAYPGGNNDIARVVQTLPGVSGSVGGFRNDVIIRGGAPNENVYYLDGIEIPNINHFATQGSAGGPIGLLNVSFFEGVSLSASAFGAQYDNVLSGVLQFDQRTGNQRELTTNFRLSSSEAALTLEGPLFKGDQEESKTSFIASVRRSYLQFLFGVIGLPILPDYWDFQYKLTHQFDKYNELLITGVGSIDNFSVAQPDEFDPEQQAVLEQVPVIEQQTNTTGLSWRRRFQDQSGFMQTTLSTNILNNNFSRFDDNVNQTGLYFQNDSREQEIKLRYNLTKFAGIWTWNTGFDIQNVIYDNDTRDLVNNTTFSTGLNFYRYGLFAQATGKVLKERLTLTGGVRADANSFTTAGNEIWRTISPRASASYALTPTGEWTINASVGRYFKIPPYTILGFQNNNGVFVNRNSSYIRSDHAVAGLEYLLNERSRITLEGFFKWYEDYPVSLRDSVSLANKGGGFEVLGSEPVQSNGQGRSYGLELLFQQKFNGNFYAITSFTFYHSEFSAFDGDFIPSVWDNGVLISLLGGYKLPGNWEISARYRYLGRTPFAPVDQVATLQNYPAVIQDFNRIGEVRTSPFSQADIRVDKKWSFEKFSLDLFLDIQNILAQANPEPPQFGLARSEMGEVIAPRELVQVNTVSTASVLPSIGIVINF